ncbi:hypothetical protein [Occallatibacter riparius]|uniref:Uncharacterized protein n=1 Tax=Occallatibacter riparius TaxID=1002689 RepID=A0A9J7BW94_9BACT|nr:hypothetical protein [Occallatibacter riparius]UWZ85158.1 hypothetical protein MOP44_04245 [Occallatibacter riparius]
MVFLDEVYNPQPRKSARSARMGDVIGLGWARRKEFVDNSGRGDGDYEAHDRNRQNNY